MSSITSILKKILFAFTILVICFFGTIQSFSDDILGLPYFLLLTFMIWKNPWTKENKEEEQKHFRATRYFRANTV